MKIFTKNPLPKLTSAVCPGKSLVAYLLRARANQPVNINTLSPSWVVPMASVASMQQ